MSAERSREKRASGRKKKTAGKKSAKTRAARKSGAKGAGAKKTVAAKGPRKSRGKSFAKKARGPGRKASAFIPGKMVAGDYVDPGHFVFRTRAETDQAMAELTSVLFQASEIEEIAWNVLNAARQLTGSRHGFVGYINPDTGRFIVPALTRDILPRRRGRDKDLEFEARAGLTGWVLDNKQPLLTNDPGSDSRIASTPRGRAEIENFLGVPALAGEDMVGQIAVANSERGYTEGDVIILARIAELFASAMRRVFAEKRTEQEVRKWRSTFDAMPDAIMIIDRDHRIRRVNAAACDTFGTGPDDLEGRLCYELLHGTSEPPSFCPHARTLDNGEEHESEFFEPCLGKHLLVTTTPVPGPEGTPEFSVHVMRDITERKQAEKELKAHRDRLEELVEARTAEMRQINAELREEVEQRRRTEEELITSRAGLAEAQRIARLGNWDWNIATNELSWSDEIYRIFGLDSREFGATYDSFLAAVHPEDRDAVQEAVDRALYEKAPYSIEHRVVRPDGDIRFVRETAEVTFDGDKPIRMIGTVQDITERREAQLELIKTTELLESFFSTTHLMTAYMDRDFNFIRVNQAYADAARRPREDFIGKNHFDLYPHPENEAVFRRVVETGVPYEVKAKQFDHPDQPERGETFWDWWLYPIRGESGEVEALVLYLLDVTEQELTRRKETESRRMLEEQKAQAISADRLRSLGEMAAGIAHELNQPLSGVRGLAEHLLMAEKLGWEMSPEEVKEKAKLIIEQADRMSHVIEHTRMFAREADKMELELLDVNKSVESFLTMLGAQLRHRGLKMELHLADELPPVMANSYSLEQVVMNLVMNARDAICDADLPEGGVIRLYTGLDREDRERVIITVEDDGPGIPEHVMERVFDPFFTTKGPDRGTGLGLSVCKSIVEGFGGAINIECPETGGTRAVIRLPAKIE